MRDRLIELISHIQYMGGLEGKLADHLLAEGVIVPPCKVGDTVYIPNILNKQVYSYIVVEITIGAGNNNAVVLDQYVGGFILHRSQAFYFNQFGKTVFLNREEAEKALKGGDKE